MFKLLLISAMNLMSPQPEINQPFSPQITIKTLFDVIEQKAPSNRENFNTVFLGQEANKITISCFGQNCLGETVFLGSTNKAVGLFKKGHPHKENHIRVEGPGALGLTTAIKLLRQGYNVTEISTKDVPIPMIP